MIHPEAAGSGETEPNLCLDAARRMVGVIIDRQYATMRTYVYSEAEPPTRWRPGSSLMAAIAATAAATAEAAGLGPHVLAEDPEAMEELNRHCWYAYSAAMYGGVERNDSEAIACMWAYCLERARIAPRFAELQDVLNRFGAVVEPGREDHDDLILGLVQKETHYWTRRIQRTANTPIDKPTALTGLIWRTMDQRVGDLIAPLTKQANARVHSTDDYDPTDIDADRTVLPGAARGAIVGERGLEAGGLDTTLLRELLVALIGLVDAGQISRTDLVIVLLSTYGHPRAQRRSGWGMNHPDVAETLAAWLRSPGGLARHLQRAYGCAPATAQSLGAKIESDLAAVANLNAAWVKGRVHAVTHRLRTESGFIDWLRSEPSAPRSGTPRRPSLEDSSNDDATARDASS